MPLFVRITLILLLTVLLLAGVAVGMVFGLANSEAGTRWLAAQAVRWTDGIIEWRDIKGTLFGPLQLQAVHVSQPGLDIELQSLTLDWQPQGLLQGRLQINGLTAEGVRIALTPTEPAAPQEPFDPTTLQLPVDVSLGGIQLRDLQLIQGDQPALHVDDVALDARLKNGELTIQRLSIGLAGMTLGLEGKLLLAEDAGPSFDVALRWADLQWPISTSEAEISSSRGKLFLTGSASAYKFELAADLAGKDIPQSKWHGEGSGDLSRLQLRQLRGSLLGGDLLISGPIEWDPVPRWELRLDGSGIDPAQLSPEYPGQLAIALHSSGQFDPEQGLQAGIDLEQLTGTLMGYALNLNARASLVGEEVQLDSLLLESNGNQLSASGELSAAVLALDWQLRAPAPGALVAGASGVLSAHGKVAGSPETPRLQAQVEGRKLRWQNLSIPTLDATLEAGLAADDKLSMDVALGPVEDGDQLLLKSLHLQASGTTSDHRLTIELATAREQLKARMEGGLDQQLKVWQGVLAQLEAQSDDYGRWRLSGASALSLAADSASVANSCLRHDASPAQLCAQARWSESGNSELQADLKALPLELLAPALTGVIAGKMELDLATDGAILAEASFGITPGLVTVELEHGAKQLSHGGGKLDLNIGKKGLAGTLVFAAPEQGQVEASLQLPALNAWPLAETQPLRGHLFASLPDLSGLAAWVPELSHSAGKLEADIQLAGTLDRPEPLGKVALTNGAADIPMAGLQLRQIELRALSHPSRPGLLEVTGGLESGSGRMDLSGQVDIADSTLALKLKGDSLQVYNTQDARVLLSPNLEIDWSDETLKLRGQLLIPGADITPKLAISPSLGSQVPDTAETPGQIIGPSPDVVVLNAPEEMIERAGPPTAAFRIDSQVQLILGDRVNVNTLGFISRITGAVIFTNKPDRPELIPMAKGRLSLEDGTFRAFGQDLVIETGQLIFADVPATEPELNVRAVRWIDNDPEVSAAGVLITGSVTEPTLELFSRPQLDAGEIQSYLLTGRSSGDKNNVLSIGTHLSPRIYVGYGYNLIEETSEFNSLFSITPRYGIGTNLGEADNNVNVTFTHEN